MVFTPILPMGSKQSTHRLSKSAGDVAVVLAFIAHQQQIMDLNIFKFK